MADVALVPERHVLERDEGVGAEQASHAGDALGEDRVALVRHGGRSLLTLGEGFEDLPDLAALEMPNLRRDALQRSSQDRQYGEQFGVAIAAHDLGGRRIGRQAQALHHGRLHLRWDVGVRADRARDLADGHRRASAGEPFGITEQLGVPARRLEAKGDRLRMHPMAAADHGRGAVLQRQPANDLDEPGQLRGDDRGAVAQLHGRRGVEQV